MCRYTIGGAKLYEKALRYYLAPSIVYLHITNHNIIEQVEKVVSSECKENSCYSFVDDVEVDKLVKSTESKNTPSEKIQYFQIWF